MKKIYRPGAVGAFMDEYENVISELQQCVENISDTDLVKIVDTTTPDSNCRSIQTVLAHVVSSAYSYAIYIQSLSGKNIIRPEKVFRINVTNYINDLNTVFQFTMKVFESIHDWELEQADPAKKIATAWGQLYDIEQLMEHAIVHIMRHRRQIEKFKIALLK